MTTQNVTHKKKKSGEASVQSNTRRRPASKFINVRNDILKEKSRGVN